MKADNRVFTENSLERELFDSQGYIIVEMLSLEETKLFSGICEEKYKEILENEEIKDENGNWRINLFDKRVKLKEFHPLIHHKNLLFFLESLLEKELVFEGGVILLAKPKNEYKQGWHRDVWQIPEDQITERLFLPERKHNCIQVNLAFIDDDSFWVIPGSHSRPNTIDENELFNGSKHLTSPDVNMPNAVSIPIKAGQAIFYNNNLIHRGFNKKAAKRITFHASYHSALFPPTWHFYNSGFGDLKLEDTESFPPTLKNMWEKNRFVREIYPEISTSWNL